MKRRSAGYVFGVFAGLGVALAAGSGCSSDPTDKTGTTSDELRNCTPDTCPDPPVPTTKPKPTPPPPTKPPPPPGPTPGQTCPLVDPACTTSVYTPSGTTGIAAELAATGLCGPVLEYDPNQTGYTDLSMLSLCTDAPAVRSIIAEYAKTATNAQVANSPCDACLAYPVAGTIWVLWTNQGPTCGSGCKIMWGSGLT